MLVDRDFIPAVPVIEWLGSLVVKALDSQIDSCEFSSRPLCCQITNLGK